MYERYIRPRVILPDLKFQLDPPKDYNTKVMMNLAAKLWRLIPFYFRLRIVRATQPKFTVSVVALIFNSSDEVLILDHFVRPGATWGLPGGFIDRDEDPENAIRREIKEEAGLDLDGLNLFRVRTIDKHIEMYYTARSDGDVVLETSEIRDYGWFSAKELPEGISNSQRKIVIETVNHLGLRSS